MSRHSLLEPNGARADLFVYENNRPRDGSSNIRVPSRGIRTKKSPLDTEEKVTMCSTSEGGRKRNHMISEKQVAQGSRNNAKIITPSVENE